MILLRENIGERNLMLVFLELTGPCWGMGPV
jgi:hypothetical protein